MGSVAYCWLCVLDDNEIFEIPKKRIGIRPPDLIQRIVLFVEDTKNVKDRTLANFAVWTVGIKMTKGTGVALMVGTILD